MVVSRADTHTARRVSGGRPGSGSSRHAVSPTAATALATGAGSERPGGVDALGGEQAGDEVAEDDGLAVGDEVDAAAARRARRREHQPLDGVVDVGRRGAVPAAADPREAPGADHLGHRRQQRRVAAAPDEARAHDDGLEAVAVGLDHRLLGARLGRGVQRRRVEAQRRALVDLDQRLAREQRGLGADVDEAPHAGLARGGQRVARALHVAALEVRALAPVAEVGGAVEGDLAAGGAGGHRGGVVEVAAHGLGAVLATARPRRRCGPARARSSRRPRAAGRARHR